MASTPPLHFTCSGENNTILLIVLHMNEWQFSDMVIVMKIPLWSCFLYIHWITKFVLLEFIDVVIDSGDMMRKNAEAVAVLLITI